MFLITVININFEETAISDKELLQYGKLLIGFGGCDINIYVYIAALENKCFWLLLDVESE